MLGLFLLALALRLVYVFELSRSPLGQYLLGDGIAYDAWARRIAGGDWLGSEVFYQSPLYPYALAVIYRLGATSLLAVRVVQSVAGAASCVLVALAGRRFFGDRAGWIAGVLLAAYPPAIFFDGEIQKASFDLLLASLLLLLLARLRDGAGGAVAAGIAAGLFALNRENALLLIPLLAAWLAFLPGATTRRRLTAAAIFGAAALATLLPVALRNRAIGGELVLTTAQLGPNFYIGNHEGADGRYQPLRAGRGSARYEREDATALAEQAMGRKLSPPEVSRYWLERGLDFARGEPGRWLALTARKALLVWNRAEIVDTTSIEAAADASLLLRALGFVLHFGVLAPLALAGIWITHREWREITLLYLFLIAWTLAVTAFYVLARYRYPMVPVLALFAGAALSRGWSALRERRLLSLAPAAAVALATAVLVNWPASARDPRAPAYASLGNAMAEAGRTDEAIRMLERAVELSPGFGEAHLALGNLRYQSGDVDRAEASYRKAAALAPGAPAWNNLGLIAARRGDVAGAAAMFERAVAAEPRHAPAIHNLARARVETRQWGEAIRLYQKLVEIDPHDVAAHLQLGNLLGFRGDFAAARQHYERALELDPSNAEAHFKLAVALERLGDPAGRDRHLARAIELEPRYGQRIERSR